MFELHSSITAKQIQNQEADMIAAADFIAKKPHL